MAAHGKSKQRGKYLRKFSAEVFKQARIIKTRFDISRLIRSRDQRLRDLGQRCYRLIRAKKIEVPELEKLFQDIEGLGEQIDIKEKELRAIILENDFPEARLLKESFETVQKPSIDQPITEPPAPPQPTPPAPPPQPSVEPPSQSQTPVSPEVTAPKSEAAVVETVTPDASPEKATIDNAAGDQKTEIPIPEVRVEPILAEPQPQPVEVRAAADDSQPPESMVGESEAKQIETAKAESEIAPQQAEIPETKTQVPETAQSEAAKIPESGGTGDLVGAAAEPIELDDVAVTTEEPSPSTDAAQTKPKETHQKSKKSKRRRR